jgi:capsular exopolysaccharide synthesis family protein
MIMLSSMQDSVKTLLVTSAIPGEGKSTVSSNLAIALAQRGKKVLLVDADLRNFSAQSPIEVCPSLSAMCRPGGPDHPRYQPIARLPKLSVVPAGVHPNDPTELLDSPRMQELMNAWRAEYDHIIIDTPPVLPFADSLVLSAHADGVILVVRSGMSNAGALLRASELLVRSGAKIQGLVLNAVPEREYYYGYPQSEKDRYKSTSKVLA